MMQRLTLQVLVTAAVSIAAALTPAQSQTWTAQGPGPTLNGQVEGVINNPVSGSINAIAPVPGNANVVYLAATNGGVWKTTNATAAAPSWTVLTDQAIAASSISSLALSPVDSNVIYAGTGSTSSLSFDGSPGIGLAKSTDGGATWAVLAAATFAGKRIVSVAPTTLSGGQVVLAATLFDGGGLYRSTNGGSSFTQISGAIGSGLPAGGVSSIVGDPGDPNRFYAGVPSNFATLASSGIYRSVDGGLTWARVNGPVSSLRILLSVSAVATNPAYAMVISTAGKLGSALRSGDLGTTWTDLGAPPIDMFPGSQGFVHGSIVAHPSNVNFVFMAGDRQNSPFTNSLGCNNFTANTWRNDGGTAWTNFVCNGAAGSSPHADSRGMAFDANGALLQGNDGGIYKMADTGAAANVRAWVSINSNIQPTEMHSVAYDPRSNITFGGTQDTGTTIQTTSGALTWNQLLQGDGAKVAVDASGVNSVRYTSFQVLGFFNRTTWNSANGMVGGFTSIPLNRSSGGTVTANDPNVQFYTPYVLNKINPNRLLMGTANIYESVNQGDFVTDLGFTGFFITSLAYGGRFGGVANPDVFYVTGGNKLFRRTTLGGLVSTLNSPSGLNLRAVAMDPENHKRVFVVDSSSQVFMSSNEGASWVNITANLPTLSGDIRAIEAYGTDSAGKTTRLLVGGQGGVFQMRRPGATGTSWALLGSGLPRTLVYDIHYEYTQNVLVAGTLGRGAWLVNNPFSMAIIATAPAARAQLETGSTAPYPTPPISPPPPTSSISATN